MSRHQASAVAGLVVMAFLGVAPAGAADIELSAWVGPSLPLYSQSFSYQPPAVPPLPGFSVEQQGIFRLDASGGVSFGAGLAWQFAGALGIELRLDTGAIEVEQDGATFTASVRPPAPLPPVSVEIETQGTIAIDRLLPVSVDLRYRSSGRIGVVASAGLSYLPGFDFAISQELGLGAIGGIGGIDLPTLPLAAGGRIDGFWGGNAGLGLRFQLGGHVSAVVEGRGFFFGERELEWSVERFPVSPELGELLREQLDPIRFTPGFFQATAGVTLRF